MTKKRLSFILAATLALAAIFTSCSAVKNEEESGKQKVLVTFNALLEFTEAVGQDKVEVSSLVPNGMEAHDFEPKAQDLAALSKADIFIYNGLGMEAWAQDAVSSAANKKLIVVEASQGVSAIALEENGHGHEGYDPHVWLSPITAQTQVINIKDALSLADPENAEFYADNCAAYVEQLQQLYETYAQKMSVLERKSFVSGHAAFAYLCRDLGLTQVSVEDVYASGEPSARRLAELAEYCRQNGVTTIFAEAMASPEASKTLANEVGIDVETIYTMENAEDGKSYLERMEQNLSEIYESLKGE